jgi:glutathione reductase (NADPH)
MLKYAAKDYGFNISDYSFDWNKIKKSRDSYIDRLVGIYDNNLKNDKVEVIRGVASFVDKYTLAVKTNPND